MSDLSDVFNQLGQEIIPEIGAIVFPDTMYILRDTVTSDAAGGYIKSDDDERNDDPVPCAYEPRQSQGFKGIAGDRLTSLGRYTVTFPTHQYGSRVLVSTSNWLKVLARGNEPEKLFKIMSLPNFSGVNFEADCELEDAT